MVAACIDRGFTFEFGGVRWGRGQSIVLSYKIFRNQNGSGVRYAFMKQDSLCDACARNLIAQQ